MEAWLGQFCINVSDLEASIQFYETLGLSVTSRTEIPNVYEAIVENPNGRGGKIQLAQKLDRTAPLSMGTAMWKLYINTDDCDALHRMFLEAGYRELVAPMLLEPWDTMMSFVLDPHGYQVEIITLARDRRTLA